MGAKSSSSKTLEPIPWREPIDEGLTVIELHDVEAEAQWLAAFYSLYATRHERDNAPTAPSPLTKL